MSKQVETISFTLKEIEDFAAGLREIPYKYSVNLINFLQNKLNLESLKLQAQTAEENKVTKIKKKDV